MSHQGRSERARRILLVWALAVVVLLPLLGGTAFAADDYFPSARWPVVGTEGYTPLASPEGIAVQPNGDGDVFVADTLNARVVRYTNRGRYLRSYGDATSTAPLSYPMGVTVDRSGNLYVADPSLSKVIEFDPSGSYLREFGQYNNGRWLQPGDMDIPWGMSVDSTAGLLWVADYSTQRIQIFDVTSSRIDYPHGRCVGAWSDSHFSAPSAVALDNRGYAWVSDCTLNNVFKCAINATNPSNITASVVSSSSITDLVNPLGIAYSTHNLLFVADLVHNRIVKIDPSTGQQDGNSLGGTGDWQLKCPEGVAVDTTDSVYIVDTQNNRIVKFANQWSEDVDPPITASNIPDQWVKGPFDVTLTSEDGGSGVASILYGINVPSATTPFTPPSFRVSAEGTSVITFRGVDNRGNVEDQQSLNLRLDSSPPTSTSTAASGWTKSTAPVSFTARDAFSGVRAIRYQVGSSDVATYTGTAIDMPQNASTQLQYWAVDNVGNAETPRTTYVQIDTIAPVTTSDVATSTYKAAATIHLSPSDNKSGVAATFYSLDGSFPTIPYSGSITIANEGYTSLRYYSVDNAGNVESPKMQQVTIDSVPPTTRSSIIDTKWYSTDVTVTLTATDTFGVASTWYRIPPSAPASYLAPFTIKGEGIHEVDFGSVDFQNNAEAMQTATVRIDLTPPSTTDNADGGWHPTFPVYLTANDTGGSGVDHITYKREGGQPTTFTGSFDVGGDGPKRIEYFATDAAGNQESTKTVTVLCDSTPPTSSCDATITQPIAHIYATDALSGVAHIYYSTDGSYPTRVYDPAAGIVLPQGGIQTVRWYAEDGAGNGEQPHSILLAYDTDPPVTTSNILPGWHAPFVVVLTASDGNGVGVANTFFSLNGGAVTTYTAGGIPVGLQGPNTVTYWSVDRLNNVEASKTETVSIDAIKPTSSSNRDTDSAWHKDDTTVTISANDTGGSGLGPVFRRVNGGALTTYTGGFSVSTDGTNTIEYYATDLAGNRENTRTATLKVDRTSPHTSTNIDGRHQKGYFQVHLSAEDTGVGGVTTYYKINGGATQTFTNDFWIYSDGRTDLAFWSTDALGNVETQNTADVILDNAPPSTTCVGADGLWHSKDQTITLAATDTLSGINSTSYRIDGGPTQTYLGQFVISNEGSHTLEYWSQDGVGNQEATNTASVKIDKSGPTSTANADAAWHTASWLMTLNATDSLSGLANTFYRVNGGATTTYTSGFTLPNDGSNTVTYWSADNLGNLETSHTVTVKRDGAPPVTTTYADSAWRSGSLIVTLNPSDTGGSGLKSTYYKVNGGSTTTYTASGFAVGGEGVNNVQFWSTDNAGNVEATKTASVRVDNTPPVTTTNAVATYTNVATITLTPSDAGSGVSATYWRLDGGSWQTGTLVIANGLGQHNLDFYSTDAIPNTEAVKHATFLVTLRFEQTDSRMLFYGSKWSTYSDQNRSGGSWMQAGSAPATGFIAFRGTAFDLIASKTPALGIMRVTLDASSPVDVDLYSGSPSLYLHQQKVYSASGLSTGTHLLKVEYAGSKNANSTGTMIGVDAIDVVGDLVAAWPLADTVAPSTTATAPTGWRSGSATVTLSATDDGSPTSGVTSTYYRIGSATTTYSAPFAISTEGTTTLEYWSVDAAGNAEAHKTIDVHVDSTAPVTSDNAPASWVSAPVDVSLTPADGFSGVTATYYQMGDGATAAYAGPIHVSTDGTTIITYWSVDAAGNTEATRTASVKLDRIAPITTDNAPASWQTAPVDVTLTPADGLSGTSATYYRINGGTQTLCLGPIPISADGTTTVTYWSVDGANNVESARTATVKVDKTMPTVSDNALASYSSTATITFNAADSVSGLVGVRCSLDGGAWTTVANRFTTTVGGTHALEYYALDAAGNSSAHVTRTFNLARRYEQADSRMWFYGSKWSTYSDQNRSGGSWIQAGSAPATGFIAFTGTAFDLIASKTPSLGIMRVTLDASSPIDVDLYSGSSNVYVHQQKVYSVSGLSAGTHMLKVEYTGSRNPSSSGTMIGVDAIDIAGDLVSASSILDTVAPSTTATAPVAWRSGSATVTLSASDGGSPTSGITATYYRIGSATTTYSAPFAISAEGTTSVEYWSVDAAGNAEAHKTIDVHVDSTAPAMSDNAVASYVDSATVSLNAADAVSGVASVKYRVNGGPWTVGSQFATTTGGPYTLDYYATDNAGNASATRTATFALIERHEQTDTAIRFSGSWTTFANAAYSGGSHAYTQAPGAALDFMFSGTGYTWIGTRNTNMGLARVTLDESQVTTVDLYASKFGALQAIQTVTGLSNTLHRVHIEYTGQADTSGSPAIVNVDRIDCLGSMAQYAAPATRYEETDSRVAWGGSWVSYPSTDLSGGSYKYSYIPGTATYVNFTGTGVYWIGTKNANMGIARVTLDGGSPVDVDMYAKQYCPQSVVWSSIGLADGSHTLKIEYTGNKNASASNTIVNVDAIDIGGGTLTQATTPAPPGTRFQQTDSRIAYAGAWTSFPSSDLSGGNYCYTYTPGSAAYVNFSGTGIYWVGTKNTNMGIARVTLDGGTPVDVDLYAKQYSPQATLWSALNLTSGAHTLRIEFTGNKNASATSTLVNIDAFDVVGGQLTQASLPLPPGTLYEQDATGTAYSGSWTTFTSSALSGGSYAYTRSVGASMTYTFSGTGIQVVAVRNTNMGMARVTIDAGTPVDVDLYSSSYAAQQLVFTKTDLTAGQHVVKIEWLGTMNPAATDSIVNVDAFRVIS